VVIAAGSTPIELPFATFDHSTILDSTDCLSLPAVPKHLAVIGAGVIGLEMGSVWARLGAKVTVLDVATRPVAIMDEDLGNEAKKLFEKQGMTFALCAKVSGIEATKQGAKIAYTAADGSSQTLEADKVLVAVGRKAATAGKLSPCPRICVTDRNSDPMQKASTPPAAAQRCA
jgi:dihydrolipoamide dehydrogenase